MLTTHIYLVPRPGMGGATPSRPHMTSWRVQGQLQLFNTSLHLNRLLDCCKLFFSKLYWFYLVWKTGLFYEFASGFLIFCRWNGGISPSDRPLRPSSTSRFVMSSHHCGLRVEICCLINRESICDCLSSSFPIQQLIWRFKPMPFITEWFTAFTSLGTAP